MIVTLRRQKTIASGEVKVIQELNITRLIDLIEHKKVIALTKEVDTIILWEGEAYDSIGQWTDTDVAERIKLLYD
jgi:hypothetical protein